MLFDNEELRYYIMHKNSESMLYDRIIGKLNNLNLNIIIFIAYVLVSIIFTYPAVFIGNKLPSDGGDAFQFLWVFWWFKEAALSLSNPYYTEYIYYPTGVDLVFSTITPFNSIISIPLQFVFGLVGTYKIIWISTFILSGYGTFLLVKYLTGDTRAAFVAGLIFMFCPCRFVHALAHINLISTQWIPLYILFLIKTVDETKRSNILLSAFFLLLTATSCYQYLIFLCVFTILYLAFRQLSDKVILDREVIKRIAMMTIIFSISAFPFMYPLMEKLLTTTSSYMYAGGTVEFSADLIGFFIPSWFHPVLGDLVSPIYHNFTGIYIEHIVFVGYTALILTIIAVRKIKEPLVRFWALSAAIFFILCLGPILHVNGFLSFSLGDHSYHVTLPYSILMNIPVFSIIRSPSRWDVLVMLSIAILAGYGACYIFAKYNNTYKKNILFLIISCLIIFEFLMIPYQMWNSEVPEFYKQISRDEDDYAILEIPNAYPGISYSDYMYYQSVHGKKLVNGYVSRTPDYAVLFLNSMPFISELTKDPSSYVHEDIPGQDLIDIGPKILTYYDIRYVVLHKNRMTAEQLDFCSNLLQISLNGNLNIYENDSMLVYKVDMGPQNLSYGQAMNSEGNIAEG